MAKLADLLVHAGKNSTQSAEWYVRFAYALEVGLNDAKKLFEREGCGKIYSVTGMVMEDSVRLRNSLARRLGKVVIVEADGTTWVQTAHMVGKRDRERAIMEWNKAIRKHEAECKRTYENYREDCKREALFDAGKGHPHRKREGKADGLGDIGKYSWNPRVSMSEKCPMYLSDNRHRTYRM